MHISDVWHSSDESAWANALEQYWDFVRPENMALERAMDTLDLARLRSLNRLGWYEFLRDQYFRWKYTAANRYASTTKQLRLHLENGGLDELDGIRHTLLNLDLTNIRAGLTAAGRIHGLGTAGASGLLALMYPGAFATVDQFVVKALLDVEGLPEAPVLQRMRPEGLTARQGVTLIDIMQRKAAGMNRQFRTTAWTPRKIDMVLWSCREPKSEPATAGQCRA